MKSYTFKITTTDKYCLDITVTADSLKEAEDLVEQDLDACPLETRSGSFISSETDMKLLSPKEEVLLSVLRIYVYSWFKSCDILLQNKMGDRYTQETGDNTILSNGFNDEAIDWVVRNYPDDLKEYVILRLCGS